MKFFKHFTDAHEGQSMMTLFDNMGHTGIACYWILVEICAAKLDEIMSQKWPKPLDEADCHFSFHKRLIRQKLRISQAKVEVFLGECSTLNLLSFQIDGISIKIFMPKLLKCLDRKKKKDGETTAKRRRNDGPDEEEDRNKEIKKEEEEDSSSSRPKKSETKIPEKPKLVLKPPAGYDAFNESFDADKQALKFRAEKVIEETLGVKPSPAWKNIIPTMLRNVNWDPHEFARIMATIKADFDAKEPSPPLAYREITIKRVFAVTSGAS